MRGSGGKSLSQADINKLIQAFMKKQKRVAGNRLKPANANLAAASLQNLIKGSGTMLKGMGPTTRAAKGGKMRKKFPDLSGDGKVTKKDILMARGVIKKKPMKKKKR